MGSPSLSSKILRFGPFEIDPEAQQLRRAGAVLRIQPQPFKVLLALVSRAGEVVTREQLRQELWGDETFVDFEHGLNYCVRHIREVLGDEAQTPHYVETIPRRGYRFIARVESEGLAPLKDSIGGTVPKKKPNWAIAASALALVIGATSITGVYAWKYRKSAHATSPTAFIASTAARRSVAVLGFRNLSGRAEEAWVSTALAEMLSTELVAGEKLRLVSGEDIARTKIELRLADADSVLRKNLVGILWSQVRIPCTAIIFRTYIS